MFIKVKIDDMGYPFGSEKAMEYALSAFRTGRINRFLWRHNHHVLATCWLLEQDQLTALHELRKAILRINAVLGIENTETSGYHESITVFWFRIIQQRWGELPPDRPFFDRANQVVVEFGGKRNLIYEYYSATALASVEARERWIPPDLKPLPKTTNEI